MVAAAPGSEPKGFLLLAPLLPWANATAGAISPLSRVFAVVLPSTRGIWISSPSAAPDPPRSTTDATFNRDFLPMIPLNLAKASSSDISPPSSCSPNVTKYASSFTGSPSSFTSWNRDIRHSDVFPPAHYEELSAQGCRRHARRRAQPRYLERLFPGSRARSFDWRVTHVSVTVRCHTSRPLPALRGSQRPAILPCG